jgi:hypothetical protein
MPTPVPEKRFCSWCWALPDEPHTDQCPIRTDEDTQVCGRCGVAYVTNCACEEGER